jgi:hypothetical protein
MKELELDLLGDGLPIRVELTREARRTRMLETPGTRMRRAPLSRKRPRWVGPGVLGRINGGIFNAHGVVPATGLAALYPLLKRWGKYFSYYIHSRC